jgi:hypothetical protein
MNAKIIQYFCTDRINYIVHVHIGSILGEVVTNPKIGGVVPILWPGVSPTAAPYVQLNISMINYCIEHQISK